MASYEIGKLVWQITGDTSDFDQKVKKTESGFTSLISKAKGFIGLGIGAAFALLGKNALEGAAKLEQQTVAFTTLLGSASKAKTIIGELKELAKFTPFSQSDLVENAKLLLNFGVQAGEVTDILSRLGDVASGDAQKLNSLTLAFAQASSAGKLTGQDLLQMINAGFNPLQEISEKTGQSMAELRKEMESGRISIDQVKGAFVSATSEGGRFYQMNVQQSQTLSGKWSTLKDSIEVSVTNLGNKMLPATSELLTLVTNIVDKMTAVEEEAENIPKSIGPFTGILKIINNDLDGTKDKVNTIFENMDQDKLDQIVNEVDAWEASSTGVSKKVDDILSKHGDINAAAVLYTRYVTDDIKLTEEQVRKLEKILALRGSIGAEAKNELESWKQRGLVSDEVIKKEEEGGKKNNDSVKQWASERRRVYEETADFINQNTKSETELLKMELDERLENLEKYRRKGEDITKQKSDLEIIYAEKVKQAEQKNLSDRINNFNGYVQQIGGALTGLLSAFQAYSDAVLQNKIDRLDAELEAELEAAGVSEETTVEQAQKEYDLAVATGDALTIEDKRKALVKAQIEEKYQKKKAELEYKAAYSGWKFQMAIAAAQIPLAIMNAVASGAQAPWFLQPGFMIAMGSIAGVTAGAQLAAVAASEPEKPKFASGGIIPGSAQGTALIAGENNRTEVIMNPDQMANTLMAIGNGAQSTGSAYAQLPPISDRALFNLIFEASQNGDLFIAQRAVTSK